MAGRYIINQTAGKRVVILDEDNDKVEGGYFNTDGTWVPFGGDSSAVYVGKKFKVKATPEAAIGSGNTVLPVFASLENGPTGKTYIVSMYVYSTKEVKPFFVGSNISTPTQVDLVDNTGTVTSLGEDIRLILDIGIPEAAKERFDHIFEEDTGA